jgi:hypothetical protein
LTNSELFDLLEKQLTEDFQHELALNLPQEALLYQTILDQNFTQNSFHEAMYRQNPVVFEGDWAMSEQEAMDPKGMVKQYLGQNAEILTSRFTSQGPLEQNENVELVSGKCRLFLSARPMAEQTMQEVRSMILGDNND